MKQRYEQDLEDILQDSDQWKITISADARQRLLEYALTIRQWQQKVRLVSRRDLELVVARHIRESLALSSIPEVRNARS